MFVKKSNITGIKLSWLALLLAVLAGGVLWWVDARLKTSADWGYIPDTAQLHVAASDLPAVWRAWAETPTGETAHTALFRQLYEIPLAVRKSTGIRPTPLRTSVWLGKTALVGTTLRGNNTLQWGLCVRPGILLRGAHTLNRLTGTAPVGDVYRFRGWHYAWRDGFLVASHDPAYVMDALEADALEMGDMSHTPALRATWQGAHAGNFVLYPDDSFSFEAQWHGELPEVGSADKLGDVAIINAETVFAVAGGNPSAYLLWLGDVQHPWHEAVMHPLLEFAAPWREAWVEEGALAEIDVDAFYFTFYNFDATPPLPTPEWALSLRTDTPHEAHPLLSVLHDDTTVPYSWNENQGVLLPLAGSGWTLGLQGDKQLWHCTGQESVMWHYLQWRGNSAPEPALSGADFYFALNWRRLGDMGYALGMQLARDGLLPWDAQELPGLLQPWREFLGQSGSLSLYAESEQGVVTVRGRLNHREAAP